MTFPNCTGFLDFTRIRTSRDILRVPLSAQPFPLSHILTRILTAVKEGLQKYCDTAYARSRVNQMWILINSKELLENLKA